MSTRDLIDYVSGMGPDATVDFMAKVIAATPAHQDQEHMRLLVDQNPHVPSRQAALLGGGEDPGPVLAAMAQGLDIEVAAEGVETMTQLEFLKSCNCDLAQGYLISRPMQPEKVSALLRSEIAGTSLLARGMP